MPLPLEPDADALTIEAFTAHAAISTPVGGRIGDRIPDNPSWPLITVATVSDLEAADPIGWTVVEQADVFGLSGSRLHTYEARTIARTIRANSRQLVGSYSSGTIGACSADVIRDLGPAPDTGRAHCAVELTLIIYP